MLVLGLEKADMHDLARKVGGTAQGKDWDLGRGS